MDRPAPPGPQTALAPAGLTGAAMLRALRGQPGLVGLFGDWGAGRDLVAFAPERVLGPGEDPFAALADVGGLWAGYLGYQLARGLERLPPPPPRPVPLPPHHLARYGHWLRREPSGWVVESAPGADAAHARQLRDVVVAALARPAPPLPHRCGPFTADVDGAAHAAAVDRALAAIADGEVYQVNLCRRLEADFDGDPLDLFLAGVERLRPRFAAFLRLADGAAVASLSPELFLRRAGTEVLTSPIKGTAPLAADPAALARSAKDRAENVMIVDLMRNDLGRVCLPGTVAVPTLARPQPHTGVRHLVSDVRGTLRPGTTDADLLRATFPPGSCTGAPKVRAMQLVNHMERTAREVYTGAVGCVHPAEGLTLNVAIRTFEFGAGRVWLGVGGGVVAESDPFGEAHETLVKARPLLDAVGGALGPRLRAEWRAHAGVFTTARVQEGTAQDVAAHLARLEASAQECWGLPLPAELPSRIAAAAAALRGPHRLRVVVRPRRGGLEPELTATALAGGAAEPCVLVPVRVPGGLGAHKWVHRPEPPGGPWDAARDALLLDADGAVLEAWRANVFAVVGGVVRTPALDGRILPGTARARALPALFAAGLRVEEGALALGELAAASEVFVTNAVVGARAVVAIEGVVDLEPGPVCARLASFPG